MRWNQYHGRRTQPKEHSVDQLVQKISEKAGISEEQARTAIRGVMDHLGDKLPAPIAAQVEKYLEGGDGGADADDGGGLMGKVTGGLGGMLGGGDN